MCALRSGKSILHPACTSTGGSVGILASIGLTSTATSRKFAHSSRTSRQRKVTGPLCPQM